MVYFPYLNHELPGRFFCSWCINFSDLWWTQYGEPVLLHGEAAHPIDALCRLSSLLWTALVPSLSWEGLRWLFYFSSLFSVPKGNVVLPTKSFFRWNFFLKDQNSLVRKLFDISWPGGPSQLFRYLLSRGSLSTFLIFLGHGVLVIFFWYFLTRGSLSRLKREACKDLSYLQWPSAQGYLLNDKQE